MSTLLALLNELEKHFISLWIKEALRVCKSAGVNFRLLKEPGKSKLDQYREEIISLLKNGITKAYVVKKIQYNMTEFT
jgi:hypothetical protein